MILIYICINHHFMYALFYSSAKHNSDQPFFGSYCSKNPRTKLTVTGKLQPGLLSAAGLDWTRWRRRGFHRCLSRRIWNGGGFGVIWFHDCAVFLALAVKLHFLLVWMLYWNLAFQFVSVSISKSGRALAFTLPEMKITCIVAKKSFFHCGHYAVYYTFHQ